ncbi:MAG: hypothetical protein U0670_03775 [Anaerolineae bacterium]
MSRPRWMKLARDLMLARGRMMMLIAAIAASVFAVALMLSTFTVMTREMNVNYLDTSPASAFISAICAMHGSGGRAGDWCCGASTVSTSPVKQQRSR